MPARTAGHLRFQSTLPVGGATKRLDPLNLIPLFQSTLPVWGATSLPIVRQNIQWISIHAPRVGSDIIWATLFRHPGNFNPRSPCGERLNEQIMSRPVSDFNPRSPCGERPKANAKQSESKTISIHAPRVGSDAFEKCSYKGKCDFNPRSPCGERRTAARASPTRAYFNPRSPCGERPRGGLLLSAGFRISIHAPRVGSDDGLRRQG